MTILAPAAAFGNGSLSKSGLARGRLLAAALHIFGEKGPEGATVREIAAAAGQNVASIAYYFGGKEQLYHAVLEELIGEIRRRLAAEFREIERLRAMAAPPAPEARRALTAFLEAVYLRLLSRQEAVAIGQLIVREQLRPSAGFEILYGRGFLPLHEGLCFLAGAALGEDPRDPAVILRTHLIMGQIYFFAMSREGILRRLGWATLEGANAELVVALLRQNLDRLMPRRARRGGRRGVRKRL